MYATLKFWIAIYFQASLAGDDVVGNSSKKKNDLSISENYAFSGVHHIFDQVSSAYYLADRLIIYQNLNQVIHNFDEFLKDWPNSINSL